MRACPPNSAKRLAYLDSLFRHERANCFNSLLPKASELRGFALA